MTEKNAHIRVFQKELSQLRESKPPISRTKMSVLTKLAMKAVYEYKHIVLLVEKFIQKCDPDLKIPGLYILDAIIRQSRHQYGDDMDIYSHRFTKNMDITIRNVIRHCSEDENGKVIKVLNMWLKNKHIGDDIIQPLIDLVGDMQNPELQKTVRLAIESQPCGPSVTQIMKMKTKTDKILRDKYKATVSSMEPPEPDIDLDEIVKFSGRTKKPEKSHEKPQEPEPKLQEPITDKPKRKRKSRFTSASPEHYKENIVAPVSNEQTLNNVQFGNKETKVQPREASRMQAPRPQDHLVPPPPPPGPPPPPQSMDMQFNKQLLDFDYGESDDDVCTPHHGTPTKPSSLSAPPVPSLLNGLSSNVPTSFNTPPPSIRPPMGVPPPSMGVPPPSMGVPPPSMGVPPMGVPPPSLGVPPPMMGVPPMPVQPPTGIVPPMGLAPPPAPFIGVSHSATKGQSAPFQAKGFNWNNTQKFGGNSGGLASGVPPKALPKPVPPPQDDSVPMLIDDDDDDCTILCQTPPPPSIPSSRQNERSSRQRFISPRSQQYEKEQKDRERRRDGWPEKRPNQVSVCSRTIWFGHLSKNIDESLLEDEISSYGDIASVKFIRPRGCAFAEMRTRKEAYRVLNGMKKGNSISNSIKIAWAPNNGITEHAKSHPEFLSKFWDVDCGTTYLRKCHYDNMDMLRAMAEGGVIDEASLPSIGFDKPASKIDIPSIALPPPSGPPPPQAPPPNAPPPPVGPPLPLNTVDASSLLARNNEINNLAGFIASQNPLLPGMLSTNSNLNSNPLLNTNILPPSMDMQQVIGNRFGSPMRAPLLPAFDTQSKRFDNSAIMAPMMSNLSAANIRAAPPSGNPSNLPQMRGMPTSANSMNPQPSAMQMNTLSAGNPMQTPGLLQTGVGATGAMGLRMPNQLGSSMAQMAGGNLPTSAGLPLPGHLQNLGSPLRGARPPLVNQMVAQQQQQRPPMPNNNGGNPTLQQNMQPLLAGLHTSLKPGILGNPQSAMNTQLPINVQRFPHTGMHSLPGQTSSSSLINHTPPGVAIPSSAAGAGQFNPTLARLPGTPSSSMPTPPRPGLRSQPPLPPPPQPPSSSCQHPGQLSRPLAQNNNNAPANAANSASTMDPLAMFRQNLKGRDNDDLRGGARGGTDGSRGGGNIGRGSDLGREGGRDADRGRGSDRGFEGGKGGDRGLEGGRGGDRGFEGGRGGDRGFEGGRGGDRGFNAGRGGDRGFDGARGGDRGFDGARGGNKGGDGDYSADKDSSRQRDRSSNWRSGDRDRGREDRERSREDGRDRGRDDRDKGRDDRDRSRDDWNRDTTERRGRREPRGRDEYYHGDDRDRRRDRRSDRRDHDRSEYGGDRRGDRRRDDDNDRRRDGDSEKRTSRESDRRTDATGDGRNKDDVASVNVKVPGDKDNTESRGTDELQRQDSANKDSCATKESRENKSQRGSRWGQVDRNDQRTTEVKSSAEGAATTNTDAAANQEHGEQTAKPITQLHEDDVVTQPPPPTSTPLISNEQLLDCRQLLDDCKDRIREGQELIEQEVADNHGQSNPASDKSRDDDALTHRSPAMDDESSVHRSPAVDDESSADCSPAMDDDSSTNRSPAMGDESSSNRSPAMDDESSPNRSPAMDENEDCRVAGECENQFSPHCSPTRESNQDNSLAIDDIFPVGVDSPPAASSSSHPADDSPVVDVNSEISAAEQLQRIRRQSFDQDAKEFEQLKNSLRYDVASTHTAAPDAVASDSSSLSPEVSDSPQNSGHASPSEEFSLANRKRSSSDMGEVASLAKKEKFGQEEPIVYEDDEEDNDSFVENLISDVFQDEGSEYSSDDNQINKDSNENEDELTETSNFNLANEDIFPNEESKNEQICSE